MTAVFKSAQNWVGVSDGSRNDSSSKFHRVIGPGYLPPDNFTLGLTPLADICRLPRMTEGAFTAGAVSCSATHIAESFVAASSKNRITINQLFQCVVFLYFAIGCHAVLTSVVSSVFEIGYLLTMFLGPPRAFTQTRSWSDQPFLHSETELSHVTDRPTDRLTDRHREHR